jgi:hypothetical protein
MINVTVVFGMVEDATLPRMGYPVQPAGTTTKHADHSLRKPNGWYFLRTAIDRNKSEDYSRTSHAEDASRQTAAAFSSAPRTRNARDVKSQTYDATGAWTEQRYQPPVKRREKLSDRQDIKNLDLSQCLVTRNAPDAPRK